MSVSEQQVVSLLETVLFESATQAAANAGAWLDNPAATGIAGLAAAMASSGEEKIAATIVGYYLTALGRAPSAAEIRYYVGIAEQGLSQTQIAAGQVASSTWDTIAKYFAHSPEFATRGGIDYSLGVTPALFEAVPWLYQSVLGRAPSSAELAYYDSQVLNGADLGVLFREFTASPEFHGETDAQIAAALTSYGEAVASGLQPTAIGATVTLGPPPAPTPAPAPAPSFGTFTTGTDILNDGANAGAHTYAAILGAGATLTANDHLTGNGSATLAITDNSGPASQDVIPSGVVLTGVTTVTLTTSGNAGVDAAHPFDLSGVAGVTSFSLTSSGTQNDYIAAGSGAALTVHSVSPLLSVAGFGSLAIISDSLASLDLSGTGGAITITDPAGPTSLTIAASVLTQFGDITDASNHITELTIDGGSGAASFIDYHPHIGGYAIIDSALTGLTITGNVTFGAPVQGVVLPQSLTLFDSTTATGGIYLSYSGSGATFNFGSGGAYLIDQGGNTITGTAAEIFNSGTATGESITLGNGNSYIGLGDGGGDTVTLGNGNNSVTLSATSANDTVSFGNGNNSFTDNATGGNHVTFGTGSNTADLGHNGNVLRVGADAAYGSSPTTANLVVSQIGTGSQIVLSSLSTLQVEYLPGLLGQGGSAAGTISGLETALASNHPGVSAFALDIFAGSTFIVASASGGTLGAGDTTIIQLVGYAGTVSWSGADNVLHLG